jgi:hypothetical protein
MNARMSLMLVVLVATPFVARFDADVAAVKGNEVTANFIDSYKQPVATLTFTAAPLAVVSDSASRR